MSGRHHRGLLTADDLARWTPSVERPLHVDHGAFRVFKCGPWSQGPSLLQALQILSGMNVAAMDPLGPDFVHAVAETVKLAMADRDAWYGDSGPVPMEALLSADYATQRRALIGETASRELRPGRPGGLDPHLPRQRLAGTLSAADLRGGGEPTMAALDGQRVPAAMDRQGEAVLTATGAHRGDTCHVDVADRWGNMVAATPSGGCSSPAR
ncbi:MAG: gamma-glutamyltransferase [Acetobacteraceae bacterium]